MSYKLEPTILSCDMGQQIPCFDGCLLLITWMSNINLCQAIIWIMAIVCRFQMDIS